MPTIRMSHPDHGFTHAYDTGEVKRLEGFGWKVESKQDVREDIPRPASQLEKDTAAAMGRNVTGPVVEQNLSVGVPVDGRTKAGKAAKKG